MRRPLWAVLGLAVIAGGCREAGDEVQPAPAPATTTSTVAAVATTTTTTAAPVPAQATVRAELTEVYDFRGPPDKGSLALTLSRDQARICYEILLRETDRPTEIHIHEGVATVASLSPQLGTPGQAGEGERGGRGGAVGNRSCQPAETALVERLLADPSRFSADVHTALAPGGAVRGTFSR